MRISQARTETRDRRAAAVHEAGHIVMARHLRLVREGDATIWPCGGDSTTEKTWIGRSEFIREPAARPRSWATVAVAGAIAEFIWDGFEEWDLEDIWSEPETMSESDWRMAGCEPGHPTNDLFQRIGIAFRLFNRDTGRLWKPMTICARRLIEESRGLRWPPHGSRTTLAASGANPVPTSNFSGNSGKLSY